MTDTDAYKKNYLAQLKKASGAKKSAADYFNRTLSVAKRTRALRGVAGVPTDVDAGQVISHVADRNEKPEVREAGLRSLSGSVAGDPASIQLLLRIIVDATEPEALRLAALVTMRLVAFSSLNFAKHQPEYFGALRAVLTDPNPEIRESALETLAAYKDDTAQKMLLDGLKNPETAALAAPKAIRLLAYDLHSSHFGVLREVIRTSKDEEARTEAIRLLGSDASSKASLHQMLGDRSESEGIRTACALALHAQDPESFEAHAKKAVLDDQENATLRATALNMLAVRPMAKRGNDGADFDQAVAKACKAAPSPHIKRAFRSFKASKSGK